MLIDLLVCSHPMFLLHFIYVIATGMVYLIFSIIFYYSGGTDAYGNNYIYHVLKWENPGSATIVSLGIVVLGIFLHVIVCMIQKVRYTIYQKISIKPYDV
jgi:hypothetical protein